MFRRKAPLIQVGDCFVKTGGSRKIWTVMRIMDAHAQLVSKQLYSEHITISVCALADRALFQPLACEPAGDK